RTSLEGGETSVATIRLAGEDVRVFVEVMRPPLKLLVCGAGHDAIPLVQLGSGLGWKVVVVDDRDEFLDRSRFPGAADLVKSEPVKAAQSAGVDDRTHALVMSHNYLRDRDYLKSFLGTDVAYIGMLGPRARLERLLDDLSGEGIEPSPAERERVHGPAGLDIGAEGPGEIAAAIVSEILAVSRRRGAGFLRARSGPIHERVGTGATGAAAATG
ncbi:MAG: XdhC family protein, partial [Actinomycetota bacterium]